LDELSYAWLVWKWKKQQAACTLRTGFVAAVYVQRYAEELIWETALIQVPRNTQLSTSPAKRQENKTSPLLPEAKLGYYAGDSLQTVILSRRKSLEEMTV